GRPRPRPSARPPPAPPPRPRAARRPRCALGVAGLERPPLSAGRAGRTALGADSSARLPPSPPAGEPLQRERQAGEECGLARQVSAEVEKWVRVNRRPRKRKRRETEEVFAKLLPDQLLLLLEHLLEQTTLNPRTLQRLERTYHLPEQDAEVRHRWCELVVKHKYKKAYGHVERFLQEDQAMGIYLYGELMVNEDARQQQLARKCFELSKEQMDRSSAEVVAEMLF
uniref:Aminopeptidase O (putative) n=3 Tax=Sus scrofa TaxID=9823 RepID=A0A4X1V3D2_PIG